MSIREGETDMIERTYTREDMARAWDAGCESGSIATMLNLSYGVIHQPANPYREQEKA